MLLALRNMFAGALGIPPATSVRLNFDGNLVTLPDERPGMTSRVHKSLRTSIDFKLTDADGSAFEITGFELFYATRGDSVPIPADQLARGARPDSARWWLSRWEDETLPTGSGAEANAARNMTFGMLLRYYLGR